MAAIPTKATHSPWTESWREQLEETARLVQQLLTTCAFCGAASSSRNPVRICTACRCPSCRDCLLSVSGGGDELFCRHASRRRD